MTNHCSVFVCFVFSERISLCSLLDCNPNVWSDQVSLLNFIKWLFEAGFKGNPTDTQFYSKVKQPGRKTVFDAFFLLFQIFKNLIDINQEVQMSPLSWID